MQNCNCSLRWMIEVPYQGKLNNARSGFIQRDIAIIGESPGVTEEHIKRPFVGRAGKLLDRMIPLLGVGREDVFLGNASRCRLRKDVLTTKELAKVLTTCRPKLKKALRQVKPKLIIALGAIACSQLGVKGQISKIRGQFIYSSEFECYILPTWHPAYVLRNPAAESDLASDFKLACSLMESDYKLTLSSAHVCTWKEVQSIRPLLDGAFPKDEKGCFITAIDTETQGLHWWDENSLTISYAVAASLTEGWQVILHEETLHDPDFYILVERDKNLRRIGIKYAENYEQKIEELKELCRRKDIKKYFMNQKFDKHRLWNLGVTELNSTPMDIAVAAHVLDSERYRNASLKVIYEDFVGQPLPHKDEVTKIDKADMLALLSYDRNKFNKYSSSDPVATLLAAVALKKLLMKDHESGIYHSYFAQPVETEFLFGLEREGIKVSQERLDRAFEKVEQEIVKAENDFQKFCPLDVYERHKNNFKLTRTVILQEALFDFTDAATGEEIAYGYHMNPPRLSTKTGKPSVDKYVVIDTIGNKKAPNGAKKMLEAYQRWNEYHVLLSRYLSNIQDTIAKDGRIHPTYSITYTASGRTGARNPSIQNFPKRTKQANIIRELLVPEDGNILIASDYSMSELRWVADVADEPTMKKIFQEGGDIHTHTGCAVAGVKSSEISAKRLKEIRRNAKAINFGLLYGMGWAGYQRTAYYDYGLELSINEAKRQRNMFFTLYNRLPEWHRKVINSLHKDGYIRTKFGRMRILRSIFSGTEKEVSKAERIGINAAIQGPSSDYALLGGKKVLDSKEGKALGIKGIAFVHDELVFEVPIQALPDAVELLNNKMTSVDTKPFGFLLSVPMAVEPNAGFDLAHMVEVTTRQEALSFITEQVHA